MIKISKVAVVMGGIVFITSSPTSSASNLLPWSTLKPTIQTTVITNAESTNQSKTLSKLAPLAYSRAKSEITKEYNTSRKKLYENYKSEKMSLQIIHKNKVTNMSEKFKAEEKLLLKGNKIAMNEKNISNYYLLLNKESLSYNSKNKILWENYQSKVKELKTLRDAKYQTI